MALSIHKFSVILAYLGMLLLSALQIYSRGFLILSEGNATHFIYGVLSVVGILLLVFLPRISLWYMSIMFVFWIFIFSVFFATQLERLELFTPYSWLGLGVCVFALISLLTLVSKNVRLNYK